MSQITREKRVSPTPQLRRFGALGRVFLWGFALLWWLPTAAMAADGKDAGPGPDAPRGAKKKPKPRESPIMPPSRRKPGMWGKIKKGMGKMVPQTVKNGWKSAQRKWTQAQTLYKAMKKFAGWDEETLRRKRIADAKRRRKERWKRADEAAEQRVIKAMRLRLWRRACFGGSARACRQWQGVAPKDWRPAIQLRDILTQRKLWPKLLPLCARLHRLRPKVYGHLLCLARASEGLKRTDQALLHYQQLTQRFPLRGVSWLALGRLQLKAKRVPDAVKACAKAVERMPRDTDALFCLAQSQLRLKQKKLARATFTKGCDAGHIAACQQVRALRPKGIRGAWVWSKMNTRINTLRVGRATQRNSCRIGIKSACRGMALTYRKRAKQLVAYLRPTEALVWLRKATRVAPFDAPSWRALGEFQQGKGNTYEACSAIARSLRIDARQPNLWLAMGRCREGAAQSTVKAAKQAFRRACALGQNRACLKVKFAPAPTPRPPARR